MSVFISVGQLKLEIILCDKVYFIFVTKIVVSEQQGIKSRKKLYSMEALTN